jgi:hypothetical protein
LAKETTEQERGMHDLKWSKSEKKLARNVFNACMQVELAEMVNTFKSRAAAATTADDVWAMEEFLTQKRREIDGKYDFRYSQLLVVFGRLVREGRLREDELHGFSSDKQSFILRIASL